MRCLKKHLNKVSLFLSSSHFSTPTVCWKFSTAFGTHPHSFISDDVCCYSQPRFEWMRLQNCSIKWGKVVALITVYFQLLSMNVYGLMHVSCMKAGWSSWPIIFTLAQLMEWPACLVCSDTADLRLQACTDFPCSFSLKCLVSLLFHQCPQHHNPYVWYCIKMTPHFSSMII